MAVNLNRWLQYAKAKLDASVASGNEELDRLEADRKAAAAAKPWLAAEGDAPTVAEAAARIRWEAEQAKAAAPPTSEAEQVAPAQPAAPSGSTPAPEAVAPPGPASAADAAPSPGVGAPGPLDPIDAAEAAERSNARIELEARARESAERLDQIRKELGIDPPPGPPA